MTPSEFQTAVLDWFDQHGRKNLPWQQEISAYSVWVSEIMLQQTQVATVIPYYQRFMQRFPNVQALARAPQDDVLHHWTGLGYYARARNLHKTAQIVNSNHCGEFPNSVDALQELPGIGRSTAGAICAIAYKKRATILDGNVKRVLARFQAIPGWPGKADTLKALWAVAESFTPAHRIADYTQAMMDLGATLCMRSSPACQHCPLNESCQAFVQGNPQDYPGKKPKRALPVKNCCFLVIINSDGEILLQKNPPTGLWGSLWQFPQCESEDDISITCDKLGISCEQTRKYPVQRHTFSHFHLDYQPIALTTTGYNTLSEDKNQVWYNRQNPLSLGLPKPVKALLESL